MRILKIAYNNINMFNNGFDVDFFAEDRVVDLNHVFRVYKYIYQQNVIAFTGINASGKTTALRLLNSTMDLLLMNKRLIDVYFPEGIIREGSLIEAYFYLDNFFYKYSAEIGFKTDDFIISENIGKYYFINEKIYHKSESAIKRKSDIFLFGENDLEMDRKDIVGKNEFLREQDSIIYAYTQKCKSVNLNMLIDVNFNFLFKKGSVQKEFFELFDSTLKSVLIDEGKSKIEFKNQSEVKEIKDFININNVLSSGTIKGINLLYKLKRVFETGGYMIIDEIENHLHKKLVQAIIGFFNDALVNSNGATLIFSTHYAEILDAIDRKDSIYLMRKSDTYGLEALKYSTEIKRNDLKKSEVYLSNFINGTAPGYEEIMNVRNFLCP